MSCRTMYKTQALCAHRTQPTVISHLIAMVLVCHAQRNNSHELILNNSVIPWLLQEFNAGIQVLVFFQDKEDVQMEPVLETILFVLEFVVMDILQLVNNVIGEFQDQHAVDQSNPMYYLSNLCSCKFLTSGTTCRASAGVCDSPEVCSGSTATCPADSKYGSTFVCRASTDAICDPAGKWRTEYFVIIISEYCNGTSNACPGDFRTANGTTCNDNKYIASVNYCNYFSNCTTGDTCYSGGCVGTDIYCKVKIM